MSASIIVGELSRLDRSVIEKHFLALGAEDRRLRFGTTVSDSAVRKYASGIDLERDAAFGVFDGDLQLLGAAHLARSDGHAEIGVSVHAGHRGRGIGGALLARAHTHARNWGVRALFMHCLTENAAMMHLARRQGMDIISESGEADAWVKLPRADASSHFTAVFDQRIAIFDYVLKAQVANTRRLARGVQPGKAGSRRASA